MCAIGCAYKSTTQSAANANTPARMAHMTSIVAQATNGHAATSRTLRNKLTRPIHISTPRLPSRPHNPPPFPFRPRPHPSTILSPLSTIMSSAQTILYLFILFLPFLRVATAIPPHPALHHTPTLAEYVDHYLSTGGQRALQARLKLQPGVYYNPLHHFTREDIHSSAPSPATHASDLALLRALTVHIPGLDPLSEVTVIRSDEASCSSVGVRILSGTASQFSVSYSPSTPDDVKPPVERAIKLWADRFSSSVLIRICFSWATDLDESTLGAATSPFFVSGDGSSSLRSDALYSPSMASALSGDDVLQGSGFHIKMVLNSQIDWHLDTVSAAPFNKFDVITTVLHELTHGLFFSGTIKADATTRRASFSKGTPSRFDQLMEVEENIPVARRCTDPKNLFNAVTNPTLRFVDDESGANFGLYSPGLFRSGSSIYHFDNLTLNEDCIEGDISREHCSDLMTPQLNMGYTQRSIGETTFRVLQAMVSRSPGVVGDADCNLPDSPLESQSAQENAVTAFTLPTWGIATVAGVAGVGAVMVAGVVVSSVLARRSVNEGR